MVLGGNPTTCAEGCSIFSFVRELLWSELHINIRAIVFCILVYKLYLKCSFFSVVDLCVNGISARCNQATVAFLRLLISLPFFSIMEVECWRAKVFS